MTMNTFRIVCEEEKRRLFRHRKCNCAGLDRCAQWLGNEGI